MASSNKRKYTLSSIPIANEQPDINLPSTQQPDADVTPSRKNEALSNARQ